MQFIWLINTGWVCEWILQSFFTPENALKFHKNADYCAKFMVKLINKINVFYWRPVIKWSFNKYSIACMVVHQMSVHSVSSSLPIFSSHIHSAVRDVTVAWQLCNCRCLLLQHHINGHEITQKRHMLWYRWPDITAHTCAEVYKYILSTQNIPDKFTGPH